MHSGEYSRWGLVTLTCQHRGHRRGEIAGQLARFVLAGGAGGIEAVLDTSDEELGLAGNGAHEICSWLAVAGAVAPARGQTMAYEPIYPWITGIGVSRFHLVS